VFFHSLKKIYFVKEVNKPKKCGGKYLKSGDIAEKSIVFPLQLNVSRGEDHQVTPIVLKKVSHGGDEIESSSQELVHLSLSSLETKFQY
jgi:hypothetical protein